MTDSKPTLESLYSRRLEGAHRWCPGCKDPARSFARIIVSDEPPTARSVNLVRIDIGPDELQSDESLAAALAPAKDSQRKAWIRLPHITFDCAEQRDRLIRQLSELPSPRYTGPAQFGDRVNSELLERLGVSDPIVNGSTEWRFFSFEESTFYADDTYAVVKSGDVFITIGREELLTKESLEAALAPLRGAKEATILLPDDIPFEEKEASSLAYALSCLPNPTILDDKGLDSKVGQERMDRLQSMLLTPDDDDRSEYSGNAAQLCGPPSEPGQPGYTAAEPTTELPKAETGACISADVRRQAEAELWRLLPHPNSMNATRRIANDREAAYWRYSFDNYSRNASCAAPCTGGGAVIQHFVLLLCDAEDDMVRAAALEEIGNGLNFYGRLVSGTKFEDVVREAYIAAGPKLYRHQQLGNAQECWPHLLDDLMKDGGEPRGLVSTGVKVLDDALLGCEGITVIGADRGVGKTTFASQMVMETLRAHDHVGCLFISLDMDQERVLHRFICAEHGITYRELLASGEDHKLACPTWFNRLRVLGGLMWMPPAESIADVIAEQAINLAESASLSNVLIVVDLHQQIPVPAGNGIEADQERAEVLKAVQDIGRSEEARLTVPIIAISEIRKSDSRKSALTVDDLLGSGRLASVASTVLLLEPNSAAGDSSERAAMTLRVAKGRDGVRRGDYPLWFYFDKYRFEPRDLPATPPARDAGIALSGVAAAELGVVRNR